MALPTMSTPKFGEAIKKAVAAGISTEFLIPVAPPDALISRTCTSLKQAALGKSPGRYNPRSKHWSGLSGDFISKGVPEKDHLTFLEWPTGNVGLLGRAYPGIDSDAESLTAELLVQKAITRTFDEIGFAERLRGKNNRRLFAFKAYRIGEVRTRRLIYKPKGDDQTSQLDIQGQGTHYVIMGTHPSGDLYEWANYADLFDKKIKLKEITDEDIDHFLENFTKLLEKQGGEILHTHGTNGKNGEDRPVKDIEPSMTMSELITGLDQLPNTEENFPHRDDLISMLAAIRAAMGKLSYSAALVENIEDWACNSSFDPSWCPKDYFYQCWNSLQAVRVENNALDRMFRRNGIMHIAENAFPDDAHTLKEPVKQIQKKEKAERHNILDDMADQYVFRDSNRLQQISGCVVRSRMDVNFEIPAWDWWKQEALLSDGSILATLQKMDVYPRNKVGLANFLRAIRHARPDCFFFDTICDPTVEPGEIVTENHDGKRVNFLNVRRTSQAIVFARMSTKTPEQDQKDVRTILHLMKCMFAQYVDYELDTLAFMTQTITRPGNMLFLVGDPGVGKSLYIEMLSLLFDGASTHGRGFVDGTKMANEGSRRFLYANIEGCRIVSHRELPQGLSPRTMAAITAGFKTMVDRGIGGRYIQIEAKGKDTRMIQNHARVIVSSNHHDSMEIEDNDRRIFYVESAITLANRLDDEIYAEFSAITENPQRLAAFFRYLLGRDISAYQPYSDPPTTIAKLTRQVVQTTAPQRRHLLATLALLEISNRALTTTDEIYELMSEMSTNEYENSQGAMDDVTDYMKEPFNSHLMRLVATAIRATPRQKLTKIDKEFRLPGGRNRLTIYALPRGMRDGTMQLIQTGTVEIAMGELQMDQRNNEFVKHPLELYRYNTRDD